MNINRFKQIQNFQQQVVFQIEMKEGTKSSPKLLRKTQGFSTSNLNKQKHHLPSRYVQQKPQNKNQMVNILNSIETNVKTNEAQKIKNPSSPGKLKLKQKVYETDKKNEGFEFKSKPMKREQSDFLQFKEIFINPIKQNLDALQQSKPRVDAVKLSKEISKEYQKLLQFENGLKKKADPYEQLGQLNQNEVRECYQEAINLLSKESTVFVNEEQDFYEEQIRIQPPDFPNSTMASTLSPGSGYAPSIPLTSSISKQNNLKQLLIRAKAGMNTEDIEKQAHLSFYLGMVYEEQRNYQSALKFYRRYLGFAKGMEDKIGMALGANRVAINYFYNDDIKKSIVFHNENLKLSDNENCFAGFYNLGICHRRVQQFDEALQYFQTALQWATQNGQSQSQCITQGQIGITYKYMELYQKSLQSFEKSLQLCHKLKKTKLQLKNLMNLLLISSKNQLYSQDRIQQLTYEAYECAKTLGDKKLQQIFSLNIGIIKGRTQFAKFISTQKFSSDIQEF